MSLIHPEFLKHTSGDLVDRPGVVPRLTLPPPRRAKAARKRTADAMAARFAKGLATPPRPRVP